MSSSQKRNLFAIDDGKIIINLNTKKRYGNFIPLYHLKIEGFYQVSDSIAESNPYELYNKKGSIVIIIELLCYGLYTENVIMVTVNKYGGIDYGRAKKDYIGLRIIDI